MAVDLVEKRRNLARELVALGPAFMDVLYALDNLRKKRNDADGSDTPIVFLDSDFAGVDGLTHLDAAIVTAALDIIPTIVTAMAAPANKFGKKFEATRK